MRENIEKLKRTEGLKRERGGEAIRERTQVSEKWGRNAVLLTLLQAHTRTHKHTLCGIMSLMPPRNWIKKYRRREDTYARKENALLLFVSNQHVWACVGTCEKYRLCACHSGIGATQAHSQIGAREQAQ